jgi:hypothetical protein
MSLDDKLTKGDKELEDIIKYQEGTIYRLKEMMGPDLMLKLLSQNDNKTRDRKCES